MESAIQPPRRVETEIEMRCRHCKKVLYTERFVDENQDGKLVETNHVAHGQPMRPTCDCQERT